MPLLRPLSAFEQAAARLRTDLEQGHWSGLMPGVRQLTKELGVNHKTIKAAVRQLEHEGLLVNQGRGRKRLIVPPDNASARPMRVGVMYYDFADTHSVFLIKLQHTMVESGHTFINCSQTLTDLKMDLTRISRVVNQYAVDAWIILAGSREVLQWFSSQPVPAFAVFGRREGLPISAVGPDKVPAITASVRHLVGLGHRRIVLLARKIRRLPEPGLGERAFLDELQAHGIATSEYHLPDWEDSMDGFQSLLTTLFSVSPPTAMIIDEAHLFTATLQFLGTRGIRVPQQVSLICTDGNSTFSWCRPSISHIYWDYNPLIRRTVRWAAEVSRGRTNVKQTTITAEFIVGGTTGPASEKEDG